MRGRKKLIAVSLASVGALLVAALAFLFVPMLIALGVAAVALIVVLIVSAGPSQRRWDAVSRAEADAAQRGDQSAFLGDRHDHTF
ncbi:MAG: hypothetical protein OXI91_14340 [Chloroflexota bacterium]|nr:hypothetical protein [Chloroflexota bacterium]